jgi:hypothetical protein
VQLARKFNKEITMKIKTNVRAGKGGVSGVGKNSSAEAETPSPVYVPPVSRCAGI